MDRLWLDRVDINQLRTGTIDSICEELLRDYRDPGTDPPVLADEFVSETLLLQAGLFKAKRYLDGDLNEAEVRVFLEAVEKDPELERNLRRYETLLALGDTLESPRVSEGFTDRVMESIASEP